MMKAFIIGLFVVVLLGGAGYFGYQYLLVKTSTTVVPEAQNSTLMGTLLTGKGDDYQYVLLDTTGKTTGVTSQTVQLGEFVNKKVEVTGSFSGSTLYVYSLTEK